MTKTKLLKELKALINGGKSYSIVDRGDGFIRIYDRADSFTATFISDAIRMTGVAFTGVTVDWKGRPYMLFAY